MRECFPGGHHEASQPACDVQVTVQAPNKLVPGFPALLADAPKYASTFQCAEAQSGKQSSKQGLMGPRSSLPSYKHPA